MERYVEILKEFLEGDRNCNKNVYRICKTIYKAIANGANEEQVMAFVHSLGGAN